jgi:RimK family alpha-L-glutamate ligase
MLARFPIDLEFIANEFQFPLVVKSIVGSKGKGVCLCESQDQMDDFMQMLELSKKENVNYIIQEFVSCSKGQDIRVIVVGGRAIGAMRRRAAKDGQFKANISIGGLGEALELDSDLEWLSIQAAKILGLDIAGVDLLFDREGYRICEVNAAPGFEGFEKATGINVPQQIYQYAQVRLSGMTG